MLEALDAVGDGGPDTDPEAYAHLEEELGDLLFQIVFHATLATEAGAFALADVARGIHDKLVHRHPHVFGEVEVDGADEVVANWEQIKKAEKGRESVFDGIPADLPALLYALKVTQEGGLGRRPAPDAGRPSAAGCWPSSPRRADADVDPEPRAAAPARAADVDPEAALRAAAGRLRDRARGRRGRTRDARSRPPVGRTAGTTVSPLVTRSTPPP